MVGLTTDVCRGVASHLTSARLSLNATMHRLVRDEAGATAIEYGLIIGGISIAILATVFAIGAEMKDIFEFVGSKLQENMGNFGGSS
ncbi:MAG: Flp family type IVb pilin [Verrucomicrobiota bacterium]|nr:Flp family type IVb pilin [Verrucomicrobiota bacterium]